MVIQAIQGCLSSPLTASSLTTLKNLQPSFLQALRDYRRDPSQQANLIQIMERMKQTALELPLAPYLERMRAGDSASYKAAILAIIELYKAGDYDAGAYQFSELPLPLRQSLYLQLPNSEWSGEVGLVDQLVQWEEHTPTTKKCALLLQLTQEEDFAEIVALQADKKDILVDQMVVTYQLFLRLMRLEEVAKLPLEEQVSRKAGMPHPRESRLLEGDEVTLQRKLHTQLSRAQAQMEQQMLDNSFRYRENGFAEITMGSTASQVGDYPVATAHYTNGRQTMEDRDLAAMFTLEIGSEKYPVHLFGILDGHTGEQTAAYVAEKIPQVLQKSLLEFNPKGLSTQGIMNALKLSFVRLNQLCQGKSGTAITLAMVLDGKIWTANVGDSRIVLVTPKKTIQLTEDQKPDTELYARSIMKRGGTIRMPPKKGTTLRVNDEIALARSLGDHSVQSKKGEWVMSARPKITCIDLQGAGPNAHLILACDGIWNVATSAQVAQAVRKGKFSAETAANVLFSACQAGSKDNLSLQLVKL